MREIQKHEFKKYKQLFENVFFNLNSLAVINGDNHGRIWLDDPDNSKTGLLVDNEHSIYLVGNNSNTAVNKQIANLIFNKILPEARKVAKDSEGTWVIYYDQNSWKDKIEFDMGIVDYLPLKRKYYTYNQPQSHTWKENIPKGSTVYFLNKEFLERINLTNFNEISNHINRSWRSKVDFIKRGFGFCLVNDEKIITSWCISDWVTEKKTEIGVATDENFRMKGYASLLVKATIDYCLKNKFKIGWHCSSHNIASQKTAESVGFNLIKEYGSILGSFDKAYILWENVWYRGLFLNQPEEGIRFMTKFLKIKQPNAFQLYNYGIILVRADKLKEALSTFLKAITMDSDLIPELRVLLSNARKLKDLKKTVGWNELIEKIEDS
jgi:RimJ/RimL family protein N-acetyltransferase